MPVVGGIELLKALRRYSLRIPTVVMSAYVCPVILKKLKELDIQNILCKPFSVGRLKKEIEEALKEKNSESAILVE